MLLEVGVNENDVAANFEFSVHEISLPRLRGRVEHGF